jgi:co-chaperonin GroES (HSP10)
MMKPQQSSSLTPIMMATILLVLLSSTASTTHALSSLSDAPMMDPSKARAINDRARKQYNGGAGIGRFVLDDIKDVQCHYDMVLVERIQGKPKSESGLFIPDEDLPRLHLCRVIAAGPGREEENGIIAKTPPEIQPGAVVIAKNPWGIGPKDEETADGRKLSYMRSQDIAAVIPGGFTEQEETKIM